MDLITGKKDLLASLPVIGKLKRWGIWGQVLSLAMIFLFFGIGTDGRFISTDNLHALLGLAGVPMLLAIGIHQTVIIGGMDLSLEGVVAIGGVSVGLLLKNNNNANDFGFWIIPVVLVIGCVVGIINGLIHTKLKMPSFIATLGVSWVFYGLAILVSRGASIPIQDNRFQRLVTGSDLGIPNITLMVVFFLIIFEIFQSYIRTGTAMYAIGGDETLAKQAGINVDRVKIIIFALAGVVYGFTALLLVTRLNSAAGRVGNLLLFPSMTAVAVGGVALTGGLGMARNAVLGALIIVSLNNGMVMMRISPYAQDAVNGLVLIAAVAMTIDRKKLGFIK
ncbi:MAG: ABC transporter permease [Planctomycetota bacterium]|jgi:ribose transport system permease protein|nr:ABC transporter permease [Planctomycetota bacterium]